jgi:hypothetical protein
LVCQLCKSSKDDNEQTAGQMPFAGVGLVDPEAQLNPALHCKQAYAPPVEYRPATHMTGAIDAVEHEYPAGQAVQFSVPPRL